MDEMDDLMKMINNKQVAVKGSEKGDNKETLLTLLKQIKSMKGTSNYTG